MSNEPRDPERTDDAAAGSESEDQMPAGDRADPSPLTDEATAQSGDDATADPSPNGPDIGPEPPRPGPMYQAPPPVRRLTRDPYSRLGGVASGIGHYYGIDVSLVRLAIVAFAVLTGVGFLLYLVAWLVIPRAEVWPPPPPPGGYRGGRMDNRQLALGLIALGLLIAVFAGGGAGTRVVIALALVVGGVWIFNQRPAPTGTPAMGPGPGPLTPMQAGSSIGAPSDQPIPQTSGSQVAVATTQWPSDATTGSTSDATTEWSANPIGDQAAGAETGSIGATTGSGGYEPPTGTYHEATAYPPPQPVPPRRRRIWPFVLIGILLLLPILAVGGAIAAFVALEGGDVSFSSDGSGQYRVEADTPAEIPDQIREGTGELEVDLSDLNVDDFDGLEVPIPIEIDMTAGQITIELPEDVPVDVSTDIGAAGDISVFGNDREGFRPQYSLSEPDALLELDVHLGVGQIVVLR